MKKLMKKQVGVWTLTGIILLAGCGGSENSVTVTDRSDSAVTVTTEDPGATEAAEMEETKTGETEEMFSLGETIEETVLYDANGIKITATGLELNEYEAALNLTIENNTDRDLSFYSATLASNLNAVNGYSISDGYIGADVSAGMKSNETMEFGVDELQQLGITDIAELEVQIYAEDEDYNDVMDTGAVQIRTSIYDSYDFSKDTLLDAIEQKTWESNLGMEMEFVETGINAEQNGMNVIAAVLAEDSYGEKTFYVEVENTTDDMMTFYSGNIAVNGVTVCGGTWSGEGLAAGNKMLLSFNLESLVDDESEDMIDMDAIGSFSFDLTMAEDDSQSMEINIVVDENITGSMVEGAELYNEDGIVITQTAVKEDSYGYNYLIPLVITNHSGDDIYVSDDYDSFSANGYMMDYIFWGETIPDGGTTVVSVEIPKESAAEAGVNSAEDFTSGQITLELHREDDYKELGSPTLALVFE